MVFNNMELISNNDGDTKNSYENVTLKVNSRCLNLYPPLSFSTKREIRHFHVVDSDGKEMYKKA